MSVLTVDFQVNQDDLAALMRDSLARLPPYRNQRDRVLRALTRSVRRLLSTRSAPMLLGPQRLEIDDQRLAVTNPLSRLEVRWSTVCSVVETPSHVLIALGEVAGIAIAKATLTGASAERVVSELRARMRGH